MYSDSNRHNIHMAKVVCHQLVNFGQLLFIIHNYLSWDWQNIKNSPPSRTTEKHTSAIVNTRAIELRVHKGACHHGCTIT